MITDKKIIHGIQILSSTSIKNAALKLQASGLKILLVVDEKRNFIGTVSDGDLRRSLLIGISSEQQIKKVMNRKPVLASPENNLNYILDLMKKYKVFQIPVIKNKKIIGIYFWDKLFENNKLENYFLIMAGGEGRRLMPLTKNCPKPMLKISGKPILLHIIEKAKKEGFYKFVISINYMGNVIKKYFGNGKIFDIEITYISENTPLGTAGSLRLAKSILKKPFIMSNGDVLTDLKYSDLLNFHFEHKAEATMAVKKFEWQNPYGVVMTSGLDIIGIEEKPINHSYVNAGIYALNPSIINLLKKESNIHITELFELARNKKLKCIVCPIHEEWQDIGLYEDFIKFENNRSSIK